MIKTTAINLVNPEPMMVTWDTGRRCNYDCTYCESTRHDNISPFHKIDELKRTFDFIKEWCSIYNLNRKNPIGYTNINFTGGEPTLNPAFWKLIDYIKQDRENFRLSLTTNGAWNKKFTEKIVENFGGVTVSYHAEGHPNLKKTVIDNILALHKRDIWLQVNVMLHVDYWEETVEVYDRLKDLGIQVVPRLIGDGRVLKSGWHLDKDGSLRRTHHVYDQKQQEWFLNQYGKTTVSSNKKQGSELGRACCGGRCLAGKVDNKWMNIDIIDTNFKDWFCTVDWYFLHIDQHTGLVYHHQTCQALHDNQRGAIGYLKDQKKLLEDLKERIKNPSPIICPNQRCGCGMCAPKAESKEQFKKIWLEVIKDATDEGKFF